ncbi:VOC family protein [Streptomyces sp. NPDC097727]|uniref:VOC family protein n=1 Tax=Streptomyces sp. NPDC097727 TaxID=3366092 RepID=UPI00380DA8D3
MTAIFRHCGLTVSDIGRSLEFWQDALGLELVARQSQDRGYIEVVTQESGAHVHQAHLRFPDSDDFIELLQYVSPYGEPKKLLPRDPGGGHVAVTCDDLPTLLARLEAAGGRRFSDPVELDRGINAGALVVYLRDPDEHIVELVQPPRTPTQPPDRR